MTMRQGCGCRNNAFSPIWATSGGSEAIGLSYWPIGIVWWLSSGGGDKKGSQNIGGSEVILGVGGLFLIFFLLFWALLEVAARLDNVTAREMPAYMLWLRGGGGGALGGRRGIVKVRWLIVQLGSRHWQQKMMCNSWRIIALRKSMVLPSCWDLSRLIRGH